MRLIEAIKNLPLLDKQILYKELGMMIQEDKSNAGTREASLNSLKDMVCRSLGMDGLDLKSRDRRSVIAKVIIANALMKMGHSEEGIGRSMNKNHASIHHYKDVLASWLEMPRMYPEEIELWNQIVKIYEVNAESI